MEWRVRLKTLGVSRNQCYSAIMEWFEQNPDRRVNENELTLMPFKRYKKGQRVWVRFATETIGRAARKLREFELLDSGKDEEGHTWFSYAGGKPAGPKFRLEPVLDGKGRPVSMKRVPV